MQIEIKKDIDTAYRDELFRGFSTKQAISIGLGGSAAVLVTWVLWHYVQMPVEAAVYLATPCALPFLAMGFITIQGLSPWGYLCAIVYTYRTRILVFEADELPEHVIPEVRMDTSFRSKKSIFSWRRCRL